MLILLYAITGFVLMLLGFQLERWYDSGNWPMLLLFLAVVLWIGWRWTAPEDKARITAAMRRDADRLRAWWRRVRRLAGGA